MSGMCHTGGMKGRKIGWWGVGPAILVGLGVVGSVFFNKSGQPDRVIKTDGGYWVQGKKLDEAWYRELRSASQLSSGDLIFQVAVGGLDETGFDIKDGRGQKVGTNKLAFRGYFIDENDRFTYRLMPVVVNDVGGKTIVNASGWHPEADTDPRSFFESRLQRGKLVGVVYLKNREHLQANKQKLNQETVYPEGLLDQFGFLAKWLEGVEQVQEIIDQGKDGQVFPVWSFASDLNGKFFVNDPEIINLLK